MLKKTVKIFIEKDRDKNIYKLWTKKWKVSEVHYYTTFRALRGGMYNLLITLKDTPYEIICNERLFVRFFEPKVYDKYGIERTNE